MSYSVSFAASAKKELRDLPAEIVERILPRIRQLADDARPAGCRKLRGFSGLWRIRIGDYRVVYAIDDERQLIDVTRIAHRKDVYE